MTARYSWGQPISSWEEVRDEINGKAPLKSTDDGNGNHSPGHNQDSTVYEQEDSGDLAEVAGDLPPLVSEGPRIMVCIDYELRQTRYALKDYLKWIDEVTGHLFHQFFPHYDKYPAGGKAVRNYIVAMGERPKRLDRISLRHLIGLRAEAYVETVKPTYSMRALKGQPMPESMYYSKVSEILRPLGRVDPDTLTQLRKK